jgi:hypothetical protein
LKTKLANRKTLKFIPTKAREELNKWHDENPNGVQDLILKFYNCALLECLDLWEESFDGAPPSNWINLYSVMEWKEIKKASNFAASQFGETFRRMINREDLFDEFCL